MSEIKMMNIEGTEFNANGVKKMTKAAFVKQFKDTLKDAEGAYDKMTKKSKS